MFIFRHKYPIKDIILALIEGNAPRTKNAIIYIRAAQVRMTDFIKASWLEVVNPNKLILLRRDGCDVVSR
jgi:hypothetical protein